MNDIYKPGRYVARLIAAGNFIDTGAVPDNDPGCFEKPVLVQTFTVCLSFEATEIWRETHGIETYLEDDEWAAWHPAENRAEFHARMQKKLKALEEQIAAELELDRSKGSFSLTKNVSEIFTIVYMTEAAPCTY